MKLKKWQIPFTIVCLISGLLVAYQIQVHSFQLTAPLMENHELVDMINDLEEISYTLEDEIELLRNKIAIIVEEKTNGEEDLLEKQQALSLLKETAGLTEISGAGILLVIDDNKAEADRIRTNDLENYNPDEYIIHYKSVLYLINELRESARAISVNNQRIVANSDVRCVGTVILINTTRMAPPYEIIAIGNPAILTEVITTSYEYFYLKNRGFPVELTQRNDLTVPAYRGTYRFTYAQATEVGEI